jgi:hypothetical protein
MGDDIPLFSGKPLGNGSYEVSEEEMKDWTIFRPGTPDFDGPYDELPHERVTGRTTFALLDIVIFFDWVSPHPTDASGCNQWAFVVDDKQALYIRGKVHSIPLSEIHKLDNPTIIRRIPEGLAMLVAPVLLKYQTTPMTFQVVVNHLQCNNILPIIEDSFFPPNATYADDDEYEALATHGLFTSTARPNSHLRS